MNGLSFSKHDGVMGCGLPLKTMPIFIPCGDIDNLQRYGQLFSEERYTEFLGLANRL
jgi:hypothetical protein